MRIGEIDTVVLSIWDTVVVNVVVTCISVSIIVIVCLVRVRIIHTVVTSIANIVIVIVRLSRIGHKRTVVLIVILTVVVRVVVTRVSHTITVSILLARVGVAHAVVLGAGGLRAVEVDVWPAIVIIVRSAEGAGPDISSVTDTLTTTRNGTGETSGTSLMSIWIADEGRTC